jgi:uncharacterized membrane protein YqiK
MARLTQVREVEVTKAEQEALIAREQATRKREAEEARIAQGQKERESAIAAEQSVKERDIVAKRMVEEADILRQQSVDISRQAAAIAVAKKSEEQSKAEAEAAKARANRVREEENVETVKELAVAERVKSIRLVKAREDAEESAIDITVAAEAEKKAAIDRAEALLTEARAQAERIRVVAEADYKRLEVEAFGEKSINEAKNLLQAEIMAFELRKIIASVAPQIIEASVKPIERIDSIKIIATNGLQTPGTASHAATSGSSGQGGSIPNQLVDSLLNYRMQSPLVDQMLKELGLDASSTSGLTRTLDQAMRPNPSDCSEEKQASPTA